MAVRLIYDAEFVARLTENAGLEAFSGGVFVPTMGGLHEGHLELVRAAKSLGGPVVVSVFVNPDQFNDQDDFAGYPRRFEVDAGLAESAGADVVWGPTQLNIYPDGVEVPTPDLPRVATQPGLEDAHRPGHFAGVARVVRRLFELVQPQVAVLARRIGSNCNSSKPWWIETAAPAFMPSPHRAKPMGWLAPVEMSGCLTRPGKKLGRCISPCKPPRRQTIPPPQRK